MKRNLMRIKIMLLTCLFCICFGSILWYMRVQKLAELENTPASTTLTPAPTGANTQNTDTGANDTPDITTSEKPENDAGNNSGIQTAPPIPSTDNSSEEATTTPSAAPSGDAKVTTTPSVTPSGDSKATTTPTIAPTEALPTQSPVQTTDSGVLTLCLTGDLMCLAGQQYAAECADGTHDFSGSFSLIQEHLHSCDFAVGNLETLLADSLPYTTELKEVAKGCPNCNAPSDYLTAIKNAGFTTLVTSNNHSLDGGLTGIDETLQQLDAHGLTHIGTYTAAEDGTPLSERFLILEKNGIKVGLVAFTELVNLRDSMPVSELEQVISCYSSSFAKEVISAARDAGAEYIIAYNHWGSENTHDVRGYQRDHAQALADAGADLIVGSHSHCLQEFANITSADGRTVPCFYSLGNLVSSMTRDINNDTILLTVTLTKEKEVINLTSTSITPCHVFGYLDGSSHVIVPVTYPVERENHQTELDEASLRIESALYPIPQ